MAEYSYAELMRMQNDAIKRAEDMQKRARKTAGMEGSRPAPPVKDEPKRVPMPNGYLTGFNSEEQAEKRTPRESSVEVPGFFDRLTGNFKNLNIDSDKALLLSLIMLLSEEGADETLLLALLYMLT